jgi:hypothetical protein
MNQLMQRALIAVLPLVLSQLTPVVKAELVSLLDSLEKKAAATDNCFDDVAVKVLRAILGM